MSIDNKLTKKMFLNLLCMYIEDTGKDDMDQWFQPQELINDLVQFIDENNYD